METLKQVPMKLSNVKSINSDNGTNLTAANSELKACIQEWNLNHIENWLQQRGIEWNFHPPYASHFGGFFEREIRSVRKILCSVLNEQMLRLTDESLSTIMCEAESILNSRPLTPMNSDVGTEALTPNHVLLFNPGITLPPGIFDKKDCYLTRRWRQVQYLANLFWTR